MKYKLKTEYIKNPELSNEELVDAFFEVNKRWFKDDKLNDLYTFRFLIYYYLLERLENGKFNDNFDLPYIHIINRPFEDFLAMYEVIN